MIGETFGHIQILDKLGSGGMGDVYLGMDQKLQRKVAVKVVRALGLNRVAYRDMFSQEARILSQLEHAHICRIYDFIEAEKCDLLVMELIYGRELTQYLDHNTSRTDRLDIAIQIAEVLVVTHARNIVHRDLKPQNVMVDGHRQAKVLDFGIAKAVSEASHSVLEGQDEPKTITGGLLTKNGVVAGTPMYMSPEQASGVDVTPSSDMYSFGLLLQWMFTGDDPYDMTDPGFFLGRISRGETLPVSGLDADLMALIERLKSLIPEVRPTAQDTLDRLKWIRDKPKRRLRMSLSAAFVAVLLAGTVLSTLGFLRAKRAEQSAIAARNQTQAVNLFLEDMLAAADPSRKGIDVKVVDVLDDAARQASQAFKDDPLERAAVMHTLAKTYATLGRNEDAVKLFQQVIEMRKKALGPTHLDTLDSRQLLAATLVGQGKFTEADAMNADIMAVFDSVHLDVDHKARLFSEHLKGWILLQEGQFPKAEPVIRDVLMRRQKTLGPQHRDTLTTMNALGAVLMSQGTYDQAEQVFTGYIEDCAREMGTDHPLTLNARMNLASVKMYLNKFDEAVALLTDTVDHMTLVMGGEHPKTINALQNLGAVYFYMDRNEDALDILNRALLLEKKVLGLEHPTTQLTLQNLVAVQVEMGQFEEGEQRARDLIEIQNRVLGPAHPTTLLTRLNLGSVLRQRKQFDEAEPMIKGTITLATDHLGPENPTTLLARNIYAHTLLDQERYGEAVSIFVELAGIRERVLGSDHPDTLTNHSVLGQTYKKMGRLDEARTLLTDAEAKWAKRLGPDHVNTLRTLNDLCDATRQAGDLDKAATLYRDLMTRRSRAMGADHPQTLDAKREWAHTLRMAKDAAAKEP